MSQTPLSRQPSRPSTPPVVLDALREQISNLNLEQMIEDFEERLESYQRTRLQLEEMHTIAAEAMKKLEKVLASTLELQAKIKREDGDMKKVLPRRNLKLTHLSQEIVDFVEEQTDPLKSLPAQEAAYKLNTSLNQHKFFHNGNLIKVESGCFQQFFEITSRCFSHVIDVFGIHWQLVMECSQSNDVILVEPFLYCLGFPGKPISKKFRMFVEVRGKLEISIKYLEEFSNSEYFDMTNEKKIQFCGQVNIRRFPVMKFPEAALGPPESRKTPFNQWFLKCFIFVNEPVIVESQNEKS